MRRNFYRDLAGQSMSVRIGRFIVLNQAGDNIVVIQVRVVVIVTHSARFNPGGNYGRFYPSNPAPAFGEVTRAFQCASQQMHNNEFFRRTPLS